MKSHKLALLAAIALTLGAASAQDDSTASERKRLAGAWRVVSSQTSGIDIPKTAYAKVVVTFADDTIEFKDGAKVYQDIQFTLDTKAKPNSIDMRHVSGLKKGSLERGIYELKDDQLTLCFAPRGRERPDEFASLEGTGVQLMKLKRSVAKKAN